MSAILLGNGLNRCLDSYPSWDDLLRTISKTLFSNIGPKVNSLLRFDAMVCEAMSEYDEKTANSRLYKELLKLDTPGPAIINSDLYSSLLNSKVKTVLTTNYDYNLERALTQGSTSPLRGREIEHRYTNETRASDKRHSLVGDIEIHHIHGELNYEKSICLGITKYIDNLAKTMELLSNAKTSTGPTSLRRLIDLSVFINKDSWKKTWAELLFNSDIYIVGLGLSSDELDIWWLLMRRAQLLADPNLKEMITNRIIYFPLVSDNSRFDDSPLKALHVDTKRCQVTDGDWRRAYESIWSEIGCLEDQKRNAKQSDAAV